MMRAKKEQHVPEWYTVSKQKEPIRLFKNDFLEFFSHITPKVVLVIWIPVAVFFLGYAIYLAQGEALWHIPIAMVAGWFIWTFVEYVMHRFIFHYHPRTERIKKIFFTFHGVHHSQPMCKTRLVMPPVMSVPLSVVFYTLFRLIGVGVLGNTVWLHAAFSAFLFGYIIYDIVHYLLHHAKSNKGYLAMCRRQHMRHHFKCPNMRFGVSMPIWDYVFGTMPSSGLGKKIGPDG